LKSTWSFMHYYFVLQILIVNISQKSNLRMFFVIETIRCLCCFIYNERTNYAEVSCVAKKEIPWVSRWGSRSQFISFSRMSSIEDMQISTIIDDCEPRDYTDLLRSFPHLSPTYSSSKFSAYNSPLLEPPFSRGFTYLDISSSDTFAIDSVSSDFLLPDQITKTL